jgi:putative MATE family efflux protein
MISFSNLALVGAYSSGTSSNLLSRTPPSSFAVRSRTASSPSSSSGRLPYHSHCSQWSSRLSYKSSSVEESINSTFALPLDVDQLQEMDVLNSISKHVEKIGGDAVVRKEDTTSTSLPSSVVELTLDMDAKPRDVLISTSKTTNDENSSPSELSSRSETRQMIKEVSAIALPSLGGMLLDPIMSLIDTACVGQVSTTSLAAMAPCTSIFQFVFFAFFFLSAATTNLVASNPPESVYEPNNTSEAAERVHLNERVVSSAASLAVILGSIVTLTLFKFADPLLKLAGIADVSLLNAARPYLLIRALGIPFVMVATVLQGASLGRGDAWRPLKIFGAAGLINLIGDIYLTLFNGWGATGAATATLGAQVLGALYYIFTSSRLEKSVEASSRPLRDVALVWRGLPSKKIVKTFMNVAVALFSRSIGLMLGFSMLTRTAALYGTRDLAAHQVTLQVWWLLSFLPEPMSVAAQTLITRDMKDRSFRVPKLIKTLYGMCTILGISAAALTCVILRAPAVVSALVADVSVQKMIASLVPMAVLSQACCPFAALSDGVCIGLGSFAHLPIIMIGSFLVTYGGLAVVVNQSLGIVGVWGCMNIFLASRIAGHLLSSTKLRFYLRKAFGRKRSKQGELALQVVAP